MTPRSAVETPRPPAGRIAVAGNLSLDDTVTPTGSQRAAPGGDALYAALGVRAWGPMPLLLTLVGDDYPAENLAWIRQAGIDTSRVRMVDGPTVHYRITYQARGERRFEWLSSPDRLAATSPTVDDYADLSDVVWLHVAAMPIEAQETSVQGARAAGLRYSLDPHEEYVVGFEERLRAIVEGAVFMPSELELRLLFPDLEESHPIRFAQRAAERLDEWRPVMVAVKVGDAGSVVRIGASTVHIPALDVHVVDPTGAGDAYCGGFIAGWLETRSPRVAAACGTVVAAETIGSFGAFAGGPGASIDDRIDRVLGLLGDDLDASQIASSLRDLHTYRTPA